MTDKDPKDMTVSEQLRWAANGEPYNGIDENIWTYPTGKIRALAEAVTGEWPSDNEIFSIVADKIDAELAQARRSGLERAAKSWAKANGWPDFREGEDFGAWLDRCALPRPRFEDGEPVQFGELVGGNLFGAVNVSAIEFTEDGTYVKDEPDGDWSTSLEATTNRLKRHVPEVLGADGVPIKVGDMVRPTAREWRSSTLKVLEVEPPRSVKVSLPSGKGWTIFVALELTHEHPVLGADGLPIKVGDTVWLADEYSQYADSTGSANGNEYSLFGVDSQEALLVEDDRLVVNGKNYVRLSTCNAWCPASWLTHIQPDTLERLRDDMAKRYEENAVMCLGSFIDRLDAIIEQKGGE